jgi:hypothetical protein
MYDTVANPIFVCRHNEKPILQRSGLTSLKWIIWRSTARKRCKSRVLMRNEFSSWVVSLTTKPNHIKNPRRTCMIDYFNFYK